MSVHNPLAVLRIILLSLFSDLEKLAGKVVAVLSQSHNDDGISVVHSEAKVPMLRMYAFEGNDVTHASEE